MKQEFEMTEAQYAELLEACKPTPAIMLQCGSPSSPQRNANFAWQKLGNELGFAWDSVEPCANRGPRFFMATPLPKG